MLVKIGIWVVAERKQCGFIVALKLKGWTKGSNGSPDISYSYFTHILDIASYADDSTPFVAAGDTSGVIKSLEKTSEALIEWFKNNVLKSKVDKCHLFVGSNDNAWSIWVSEHEIRTSVCVELLGAKLDNN